MKIILEKEEALGFIHSALCNGGLSELASCSVSLDVSSEDYAQAKAELKEQNPEQVICREDVWAQILRSGKSLNFYDEEGEEEVSFNLDKAIEELSKEEAAEIILTFKEEQDDAWTATELLQHCLYGEVIFG